MGNEELGMRNEEWKKDRTPFNFELEKTVDEKILLPEFEKLTKGLGKDKLPKKQFLIHNYAFLIQSTDRTVGTILGSEIQKKFGNSLEEDTFTVSATGGGGQSFGAFIPKGLTLRLEGDSNDAFGKGLSGGKVVVYPPKAFSGKADENIIVGNVALFGATSGQAFINGVAGERFCVRNSGATVVAEGCGDHGLEYMTGGTAVILGSTGKNLCAGMSGGVAYILDENHDLYKRLNKELVTVYELDDETTVVRTAPKAGETPDESVLKGLIEKHVAETGSEKGKAILADWAKYKTMFKKIIPNDYLKIMTEIAAEERRGLNHEDAVLAAFKTVTSR